LPKNQVYGIASSFQLFPFSQAELNTVENRLDTERNLESRLIFGSYPDVYALQNETERIDYLKSLINSYLLKDILSIDGIKPPPAKQVDLVKH